MKYPLALFLVLDGWGVCTETNGNAVCSANTPNIDRIAEFFPVIHLDASGEQVGLPAGQMGNSEVGHLNLGAGRIVEQDILRIDKAISNRTFFNNDALYKVADFVRQTGGGIHLTGLLSDGGVHSSLPHLYALVEWAKLEGFRRVYIHAFLDGRDTPPKSALKYIEAVEEVLAEKGVGRIATVCGRYYAMDRDKRWERLREAYKVMVFHQGIMSVSAREAVTKGYDRGESDEFVFPTVVVPQGDGGIKDGDGVIFFNFRADRARQLTRALTDLSFDEFSRSNPDITGEEKGNAPPKIAVATMTEYDGSFNITAIFPPIYLNNTLGEWFSLNGVRQLRIAETEKYAHVTYFFNGGSEKPFAYEDRVLIPSPKVATYDLVPEMSAIEVTDEVERRLRLKEYQFVVLNYANLDMVGHTGNYNATVKSMEVIDKCVGRVISVVKELGGIVVLTADHGKAEQMLDFSTGQPHTAHTTNLVPCYFIGNGYEALRFKQQGILADVAPTLLNLLGMEQPDEMTGKLLLDNRCNAGAVCK